jgi:peptide/nickel transport system permease protein
VWAYLLRRVVYALSLVLAVSFTAYCIFGISFDPGFGFLAAPDHLSHVKYHYMHRVYHLDDPIVSRYWRWLTGVLRHGFGNTASTDIGGSPMQVLSPGLPITPIVLRALEVTSVMVGFSLVLVSLGSALIGSLGAQRRRARGDLWASGLAYLGAAAPTFLVADLLRKAFVPHIQYVFSNGFYRLQSTSTWLQVGPPEHGLQSWAQHLILPTFALSLGLIGIYARYIRSAMVVQVGQPYVTVARAKGLPEWRVIVRHALRNSLVPFTSLLSIEMGGVIGASLAADGVFGTGGLASAFLQAVGNADPFLLTAIFTMTAAIVCLFAFVGDIVVGLLDPRMRRD